MANNLSNPFQSTCAYCLGVFHLQGQNDKPIRHGFTAHHIHKGQTGGWHTGPCSGVIYPHLGISTEGTQAALKIIQSRLKYARVYQAELVARPVLNWNFRPNKYDRKLHKYVADMSVEIDRVLTPGTAASVANYRQEGMSDYQMDYEVKVPSYEQELTKRLNEATANVESLEKTEATYAEVIRTWKPFDKVTVVKVEMVHKAIKHSQGFRFASCNRRIREGRGSKMTDVAAEVTCKRCCS